MDGGIRENLGIEGLHKWLDDHPTTLQNVSLVIISDVGAETEQLTITRQPTALDGAVRAFDLLWDEAEPAIRARFLQRAASEDDDFHWTLHRFRDTRVSLPVIYLKPRSRYGVSRFSNLQDRALMEAVMSIPTLHELSSFQAAAAFWAGAQLVSGAIPEICQQLNLQPCRHPQIATI
jgi:hypothetical protein